LQDAAQVASSSTGSGGGAAITVDADSLILSGGSELTAATSGQGNAGVINLNRGTARDLTIGLSDQQSTINARSNANATGNGGDILIGTANKDLTISGPGSITAATQGSGDGGKLDLKGSSITLDQGVRATTETSGSGEGGLIAVDTDSLILSGASELTTETSGQGNAGVINLNRGTARDLTIGLSDQQSTINARSNANATGNGGAILIGTANKDLTISGPGSITAETQGSGDGGKLDLKGSAITLKEGARATTATAGSGNGGQINLSANTLASINVLLPPPKPPAAAKVD
jgi:hypothetical protein